jgi:dTDP-4-amino-4,6-dideoxygalactose transaminase
LIVLSKPMIGPEEIAEVVAVLESGMLAAGPRVAEFEARFAEAVGATHALAVGSGTAALHLSLLALEIGPDDEVIVPSFTFAATANSVRMTGATPVFADIDPSDYAIDEKHVAPLINARTRAIMPVHLYGHPAPMTELRALADEHGLLVVEDAAQAHLAEVDGRTVGSIGDAAGFSFYPTKNMTTGEGGMITTSDPTVAERARWLRNQGMAERYNHKIVGLNERMTEIEAAIGLVQLRKLPEWTEKRREQAAVYAVRLDPDLGLPVERPGARHVYHQYTLAPANRSKVLESLAAAGIGHDIYYPKATHQQDPYSGGSYDLPNTEDLTHRVVSIPVRPGLSSEEVDLIVDTLNSSV